MDASNLWKQRLRAIQSPFMQPPAMRVLFLLVFAGALLIAMLPEAAIILPALDVVGMDLVTVIVALELRHYLSVVKRLALWPMHPMLWLYRCMWGFVWIRTVRGAMPSSAVQGSAYDEHS